MKILISIFCILVAGVPGVSRAQAPTKADGLAGFAALLEQHHESEPSSPALTLDEVERIALAANPEIAVAARRVAVARGARSRRRRARRSHGDVSRMGRAARKALELQRRAEHVQHQPDAAGSGQAGAAHQRGGVRCGRRQGTA